MENKNEKYSDQDQIIIKEAENILLKERKKRIKPFFDSKVQTDLNCYWLYSNLYSSLVLEDDNLYNKTISSINILNKNLSNKIFHCYNKDKNEIDVFLEDYTYYSLLLITLYELNNDKESLKKCKEVMADTWNLFFNKDNNLLQKNILNSNDLFVNPIDIADNNIPNGNSIYLLICNKLKNISNEKLWSEKIDILSKSYNTYLNYNFSQMFSYLKVLDICEENITVSLHGRIKENNKLKKEILKRFMGNVTVVYNESNDEFYAILCKNETCSTKLKNLEEIDNYIKNKL